MRLLPKHTSILAAIAGLVYGSILTFYALAWGFDGPTFTLPLAASPLNVPALILDTVSTQVDNVPREVMWLTSIILAPFGWLALAFPWAARASAMVAVAPDQVTSARGQAHSVGPSGGCGDSSSRVG